MTTFKRATMNNQHLSLALMGGPGTGKTYTALRLASHLGERVCLIDAERGRASHYASEFSFDTAVLPDFSPKTYLGFLHAAMKGEYDVIIVDGISPEWDGDQGCLQWVDELQRRGVERARAWAQVTPIHEQFIRDLLACPHHVIATLRGRERYSVDKDGEGRSQAVRLSMGPIQQDRIMYEFPLVGTMDNTHNLQFVKSTCHTLDNASFNEPGEDLARILLEWLAPPAARPRALTDSDIRTAIGTATRSGRWTGPQVSALMHALGADTIEDLSEGERRQLLSMISTSSGAAWASQHAMGGAASSAIG